MIADSVAPDPCRSLLHVRIVPEEDDICSIDNDETDENTNNSRGSADVVGAKQARDVRNIKLLVFLVLAMSIFGAVTVFFYNKRSELAQFEQQFYDDANKVTIIFNFRDTKENAQILLKILTQCVVIS
jgi:hypothetical protein